MQTPTLLLLLSSLSFLTVSATPPACLLAAINVQTDPSDLKSLCGTLESAVAGNITAKCSAGDQYKSAVSAYEATCFEGAGVNITITSSSSSSASATGTGTASGSVTATSSGAKITASGTAAATGTATGTSGSTASATGSSASASGITVASGAGALVVPGLLTCVGLVGAVLF